MNSNTTDQPAFDLTTLDVLLESFSAMAAKRETARADFYTTLTRQVAAATESVAACILVKNAKQQIRFVGHDGLQKLATSQIDSIQNGVKGISQTKVADAPHGIQPIGNARKLAFARCQIGTELEFLFCLLRPQSDDALTDQVHQDLARELIRQIEIYETQQAAVRSTQSATELAHIAKLGQDLGTADSTQELAFHLVNDLAQISHSDRVTFFSANGRILAISGVSQVAHQTNVARTLGKIARVAATTRGIEWHGEHIQVDSQRPPRGLASLIESVAAKTGYVLPLLDGHQCFGILLFEYFESDESFSFDRRERINEVVSYVVPIIDRNFRDHSIPAFAWQKWFFNRIAVRSVRSMALVLSTCMILAAIGYWLFWLESPFEIYGEGSLDTISKQHVFTHVDGEIEAVYVEEQSTVAVDQPLLLIRSRDLEKDQTRVAGQIEETQTELQTLQVSEFQDRQASPLDEAKRASDIKRLKIRLATLQAQQTFYNAKAKQLNILAPIDGVVTTQQIARKLRDRPVNRGDLLMTVSETDGEWELKVDIPDSRIEFVKAAMTSAEDQSLDVHFRLTIDSTQTFVGQLNRLDYRSQPESDEQPATVVAYVSIDEASLAERLTIGTRVYAKIDCGTRSNFFLLTYEARNRIRQWLF